VNQSIWPCLLLSLYHGIVDDLDVLPLDMGDKDIKEMKMIF